MSDKKKTKSHLTREMTELRLRAEERTRAKTADLKQSRGEDEMCRLVQELEVHQVELEMQNEELLGVQEELERARDTYTELYDFAPIGYFTLDDQGLIREVNLAGAQLLGKERPRVVNKPLAEFIADAAGKEAFSQHLESVLQIEDTQKCDINLKGKNGRQIHGQFQSVRLSARDCETPYVLTAIVDNTTAKLAAERLKEVSFQQQAILNNILDSVWLKDLEGRYVIVNNSFCQALAVSPEELLGKTDFDVYPHSQAERNQKVFQTVLTTGSGSYYEESRIDPQGKTTYLEKTQSPIFNAAGLVIGVIGVGHDFTNRKNIENSLFHQSTHDSLTGLYNRAFFDGEIERLAQGRAFPISVVMADINGMKTVNDSQGHAAGDKLIQAVAQLIHNAFRVEDIVARIGGDEFAILLPGADKEVAEEVVGRILTCDKVKNGQLGIAFGIATAENRAQLMDALKVGDQKMYRMKLEQRGSKPTRSSS